MEKKIIKKEVLDKLFMNLLAFADLGKITKCVNLFMNKSHTEEEVLEQIKVCYNNLCQDIADKEIDENLLPIGYGWGFLMLEYTGGEPDLQLTIEAAEAYSADLKD